MFLYTEDDVTPKLSRKIENLIGQKIPFREQLRRGTVGSGLYYIRKLIILKDRTDVSDLNARCTFEKFERGLLLRINDRRKLYSIAIPYTSIDHIGLIRGEEFIKPFPFSPMWILLKIGIPFKYSVFFIIRLLEYRADPMVLKINSGSEYLELYANAKNYKGEEKYFKDVIERLPA